MTYGQTFTWRDLFGSIHVIDVSGESTKEEARRNALMQALSCGWTPPKLWQFWRWTDQPRNVTNAEIEEVKKDMTPRCNGKCMSVS